MVKVSETLHLCCLNQCINNFEFFDVIFYFSFYLKMDFMSVKVPHKFEDFFVARVETANDFSYWPHFYKPKRLHHRSLKPPINDIVLCYNDENANSTEFLV